MLRPRLVCRVLLFMAMAIFAGHVCELPAAEHFVFVHAVADPGTLHEHGEDTHAESCDGRGTSLNADTVVAGGSAATIATELGSMRIT